MSRLNRQDQQKANFLKGVTKNETATRLEAQAIRARSRASELLQDGALTETGDGINIEIPAHVYMGLFTEAKPQGGQNGDSVSLSYPAQRVGEIERPGKDEDSDPISVPVTVSAILTAASKG